MPRTSGPDPLPYLRACIALLVAGALAACQQAAPPSESPGKATPPVAVAPPAPAAAPAPAAPVATVPPKVALPATDFLPGPLYFCDAAGSRTAIEYESRVEQLCRRHPEMGPCQYERDACRARGGRVYTARNEEVTPAVEAEYDKVVRRVRFQADGGTPAKKK